MAPLVSRSPEGGHHRLEDVRMDTLLDAFAAAWNRHDIDALMSMMTTDCVFEASGGVAVNGVRHEGQ